MGLYDGFKVTAKCGHCGAVAYYPGTQFVKGADGKTAVKAACDGCFALALTPHRHHSLPFKRAIRKAKPKPVKVKVRGLFSEELDFLESRMESLVCTGIQSYILKTLTGNEYYGTKPEFAVLKAIEGEKARAADLEAGKSERWHFVCRKGRYSYGEHPASECPIGRKRGR